MNQDQINSLVRSLLLLALGYLASKGVITSDQETTLLPIILTAVGAVAALGAALWGIYSSSHTAKIAAINAVPGLKVVAEEGPGVELKGPPK